MDSVEFREWLNSFMTNKKLFKSAEDEEERNVNGKRKSRSGN